MMAYINQEGIVGQMFDTLPQEGLYHPDFLAKLVPVSEEVASGWRYDGAVFLPPEEAME